MGWGLSVQNGGGWLWVARVSLGGWGSQRFLRNVCNNGSRVGSKIFILCETGMSFLGWGGGGATLHGLYLNGGSLF